MSAARVAIIGLDCFDFRIRTEYSPDAMPTLRRLMAAGRYGRIESPRPCWPCSKPRSP
jgi:predicted AlkP superfamily phosphohydrolase/phosphomutase